ncbi:unnamed protein product [Cochlearia groenlandica]
MVKHKVLIIFPFLVEAFIIFFLACNASLKTLIFLPWDRVLSVAIGTSKSADVLPSSPICELSPYYGLVVVVFDHLRISGNDDPYRLGDPLCLNLLSRYHLVIVLELHVKIQLLVARHLDPHLGLRQAYILYLADVLANIVQSILRPVSQGKSFHRNPKGDGRENLSLWFWCPSLNDLHPVVIVIWRIRLHRNMSSSFSNWKWKFHLPRSKPHGSDHPKQLA